MFFKKLVLSSMLILGMLLNTLSLQAYQLIPGGESIGIVLNYQGVVITDTYIIEEMDHYDPSQHGFKSGDIITEVNGVSITNMSELVEKIESAIHADTSIILTLHRQGDILKQPLKVYYDDVKQTYSTGLFIRDSLTGIGTITYYNPENHTFGCLGHSMNDQSMPYFRTVDGDLFQSYVLNIVQSENGQPGEKIAKLDKEHHIGTIKENNEYGVFGTYDSLTKSEQTLVETASMEEIELGPAYIYTVIENQKVEKFDIMITDLKKQDKSDIKGITFTVTDQRLLEKTNGIVQGMSGSPIFQNGKLIGCITHVSTQDVMTGYGLYIEWMIENSYQQGE